MPPQDKPIHAMPPGNSPIAAHETNLDEIIRSAAAGHEPEGYADLTDLHLHTCLTQLYLDYNAGRMDLDRCKAMKEKLVSAWKADKDALARYNKAATEWNDKIRQAELTGKQLHKAETLREFAQDAAIVVEVLCGEVGLVKKVSELA